MLKYLFILFLFQQFLFGEELKIIITGIDSEKGNNLLLAVYDSEDDWLKDGKEISSAKKKVDSDRIEFKIGNFKKAKYYAISVFHDENADGELNFSIFPPGPSEGVGISNDAKGFMGPPKYKDAKFKFDKKNPTIKININY
jgi:uncharacterized protein (DUF2141 family)